MTESFDKKMLQFMDRVQAFAFHAYKDVLDGDGMCEEDSQTMIILHDYAETHGWLKAYHSAAHQGKQDAKRALQADKELH